LAWPDFLDIIFTQHYWMPLMSEQTSDTNHGTTNIQFLNAIDAAAKDEILHRISLHYSVSKAEVLEELGDKTAEHLLDYMVEPHRSSTSVLMQRHGFR
jgi:hypothetical protein